MEISLPGNVTASLDFPGVPSILVQKDIFINGGSLGANVTFVNQGFSSTVIPEPTSVLSMSIGMVISLWAFRRYSKRAAGPQLKHSAR
jgi:hypothetical protein